jgi:hypothetical protein
MTKIYRINKLQIGRPASGELQQFCEFIPHLGQWLHERVYSVTEAAKDGYRATVVSFLRIGCAFLLIGFCWYV